MIYKCPNINRLLNLIVFYFTFMVLIACGANQATQTSEQTLSIKQTPKIVFINYAIKKDSNGKKTVQYINSKRVDGKLKKIKKILFDKGVTGDLICSQLNATSATLSQQLIKNPLVKTVEYVDETKNFKVVQMELDSSVFSIRLQLYPEAKYIAINTNNEQNPLILTKVSEL